MHQQLIKALDQKRKAEENSKIFLELQKKIQGENEELQNKIRNAIWRQSFKEASNLSKTMQKPTDKKIGSIITEKLLGKAIFVYCRDHDYLYDLIMKGKYEEVLELLTTVKEKRGLNLVDEQFLVVVSDMLYILNEKKIPLVDEDKQILKNINFKVNDGEYICLVGENGSGKSTIFEAMKYVFYYDRLLSEHIPITSVGDEREAEVLQFKKNYNNRKYKFI